MTAKNALKLEGKAESGEFIPEAVRRKIEEKLQRTPEEKATLKKEKKAAIKKDKVRKHAVVVRAQVTWVFLQLYWLNMELRLLDIDLDVKKALHVERPDIPKCLDALDKFDLVTLTPLMLKKQPDFVTTIRKIRKYVGPVMTTDATADWTEESRKIRLKADQVQYEVLKESYLHSLRARQPFINTHSFRSTTSYKTCLLFLRVPTSGRCSRRNSQNSGRSQRA